MKLFLSHLKGDEVVPPELLGIDCHCQTFFFHNGKSVDAERLVIFFSRYVVMETNIWLRAFSTAKWTHTLWAHTLGKDFMLVSLSKVFSPLRKGSHPEKKECEGQPAGFLLEAGGSGLWPCPVICQNCDAHLKHLRTSLLCFPQTVGEMGSATLWGKPGRVFTNYYSFTCCSHPAAFELRHRILISEWIHSMPDSVLTLYNRSCLLLYGGISILFSQWPRLLRYQGIPHRESSPSWIILASTAEAKETRGLSK